MEAPLVRLGSLRFLALGILAVMVFLFVQMVLLPLYRDYRDGGLDDEDHVVVPIEADYRVLINRIPARYELVEGEEEIWLDVLLEDAIHTEMNRVRVERGVGKLPHEDLLRRIARDHSVNMARHDVMDHVLDGRHGTDRALEAGHTCRRYFEDGSYTYGLSENLNMMADDAVMGVRAKARMVIESWLGSPGHRENMLDSSPVSVGIGVAVSDTSIGGEWTADGYFERMIFVTQNFSPC